MAIVTSRISEWQSVLLSCVNYLCNFEKSWDTIRREVTQEPWEDCTVVESPKLSDGLTLVIASLLSLKVERRRRNTTLSTWTLSCVEKL